MTSIDISAPDDWHVHLRDDHMLGAAAPFTAACFRHALVMPNLVPPITSSAMARQYRDRILAATGPSARSDFRPLMGVYLNDSLVLDDLIEGVAQGEIFAAKYYPAGATTNSEAGGASLIGYRPILEAMAEHNIALLVHAESTNPDIDIFDREAVFLEAELATVCAALPELRVTVEHISTRAGLDFVRSHNNVAGSITPHHLTCDRTDVLANGLRPDLYCKPVINSRDEKLALVEAATSADASFFYGTDSAPHPLSQKESSQGRPGIFNAPYALEVVAELFYEQGKLDCLERFVSFNGVDHYGLARTDAKVRLNRHDDGSIERPSTVRTSDGHEVRIFGAEAARLWEWRALG